MATPLINALRIQGGTFYTFISSANDISKTFSDDDARFVFSKFVLLDLPDVATPSNNKENYIVWEALGARASTTLPNSSVSSSDLSTDNNINFAQSFQNYVLNFEQLILDGKNDKNTPYNSKEKNTVGERLFWKWLASINAIRFRNANNSESAASRFVEENETAYYKKVVKYIGDIDVVNNVSKHGQTYSEIYLNVPSSHGNTPIVLFKSLQDSNYSPGKMWNNGNISFIDGRNSSSIHPSGLSLTPYWDDKISGSYFSYGSFNFVTNIDTNVSTTTSPKPVLLSRLDGIILDTDANNYKPINIDPNIRLISEYNSSSASGDFSFNAALIYYDIYDVSAPANRARNLYGILVLDDYDNNATNSYIKRFDKYKSNKITKMNGNGYGLKLNIKFDTSADNVGIETVINEYNTYSMALFSEATSKMQEAANLFIDQKLELIDVKSRLDNLENYFYTQDDLTSITQRITLMEQKLNNASISLNTNTVNTLIDLINKNSDNINNLITGKLTNTLSYNTDIINAGDGMILDKSIKNQVTLINRNQAIGNFMICKNSSGYLLSNTDNGLNITSTSNNNILVLGKYNNYFKQKNQNPNSSGIEIFDDNLYINIDDSNVSWSKGQLLKIVFDNSININGLNIIFRTDSKNVLGEGSFGKIMAIIKPSQLISNKPIIEIYCENEKLYTFGVDILR
jgi:hypothetical protein